MRCKGSGCFHLHSPDPLFTQLITMSGTSLIKAKPPKAAEGSFMAAVQLLDVAGDSISSEAGQVEVLLSASMADIRDKIGRKMPLGPVVDGDLVPQVNTFELMSDAGKAEKVIPGMKWCKRIMMGDCQNGCKSPFNYFISAIDAPGVPVQFYADAVTRAATGRRFFMTKRGRMGLGPADLQLVDRIVVFEGYNIPLAVRAAGDGVHALLVGETYTSGIMEGEVRCEIARGTYKRRIVSLK